MNKVHIFDVSDTFNIEERGVVIVGNSLKEDLKIINGDSILITTPGGVERKAKVIGADYFTKCFADKQAVGLLIKIADKSEVPLGSKIHLFTKTNEKP